MSRTNSPPPKKKKSYTENFNLSIIEFDVKVIELHEWFIEYKESQSKLINFTLNSVFLLPT